MIEWLEHIDRTIFFFINTKHTAWLDIVMMYITKIYIFAPLFVYWLLMTYDKFPGKRFLLVLAYIVLLITLTDQSATITKNNYQRYRPTHNVEIGHKVHVVDEYRGGQYGFFSGHASNTFGIATFLFLIFKRRSGLFRITFFLWAGLIAYSRIYLGVHYPSDIFVGMCTGILWGFVVYKLFIYSLKYFFPEKDESHLF